MGRFSRQRLRIPDASNHDIDFFLDFREHCLIGDADTFEHMMGRIIDGSGSSDKINMREPAFV